MLFTDLKPGDKARIISFANLEPGYRNTLLSLGMTPGTAIEVKHVAPFGDPVEVLVRGYRLSLRRSEAGSIELESL